VRANLVESCTFSVFKFDGYRIKHLLCDNYQIRIIKYHEKVMERLIVNGTAISIALDSCHNAY